MDNFYVGSQSLYRDPQSLSQRWPVLPVAPPGAEISIAAAPRGLTKLAELLSGATDKGPLSDAECLSVAHLLAAQLGTPDSNAQNAVEAVSIATELLQNPNPKTRAVAAGVLAKVVDSNRGRGRLLQLTSLSALARQCGDDGEEEVRQGVAAVLTAFARSPPGADELLADDAALAAMCSAARVGVASGLAHTYAALVAAGSDAVTPLLRTAVVPTLIHLLADSPAPAEWHSCLLALRLLLVDDLAKQAALDAGIIAPLVSCLRGGNDATRTAAVGVLAVLAITQFGKRALLNACGPAAKGDLVPVLVSLLHDGNELAGATAGIAIRHIAEAGDGRRMFVEALFHDVRSLLRVFGVTAAAECVAALHDAGSAMSLRAGALDALVAIVEAEGGEYAVADALHVVPALVSCAAARVEGLRYAGTDGRNVSPAMRDAAQYVLQQTFRSQRDMLPRVTAEYERCGVPMTLKAPVPTPPASVHGAHDSGSGSGLGGGSRRTSQGPATTHHSHDSHEQQQQQQQQHEQQHDASRRESQHSHSRHQQV